jgi:hypothetical protein
VSFVRTSVIDVSVFDASVFTCRQLDGPACSIVAIGGEIPQAAPPAESGNELSPPRQVGPA